MKIFKPKFWSKKNSLIGFILLPFSILVQILLFAQSKITISKKFSIPVICVGNIYIGGTGKTPLTIEIATTLQKLNKKVAIIKNFKTPNKIIDQNINLLNSHGNKILQHAVMELNKLIKIKE